MKIFKTKNEYLNWRKNIKKSSTIGFVPTMGALHKGHLTLVENSIEENDLTVCSIFVNPTQFNNPEDLKRYPNTLEKDLNLLEKTGCDVAFCPATQEMYPKELKSQKFDFSPFDSTMEGANRKGHFDGVGTIVGLLFENIFPNKAYFGEKDFQQLKIIQALVKQKGYPAEIVPCKIVREDSGLAMSSRNLRLSDLGREKATFLYQILKMTQQWAKSKPTKEIKKEVELAFFNQNSFTLEYFEIATEHTLQPTEDLSKANLPRAFIAAEIEGIRLIDNMPLNG